jgi:uncharacterized protein (DUF2164 family)
MKNSDQSLVNYMEYMIIAFLFMVLFITPVLFTRINGEISWTHVIKIWKDQSLLLPVFLINHWLFVPKILLKRRYVAYFISVVALIAVFSFSYYYYDVVINAPAGKRMPVNSNRPTPIEPYALLLMYSLLIVGVDTGLCFSKKWHENEEHRNNLEKKNAEIQLEVLRNQISPHFFMNTLNNIYALIDRDTPKAKEAVMKLSKLMRYMLYENETGRVKLSREFEFIKSYIDLMKLRFADEMTVHLIIPSDYKDLEIPPMLFISYIENAFKYGPSYQNESFINIVFEIADNKLFFICHNTKHNEAGKTLDGGLGMKNNKIRLDLLFGTQYLLAVDSTEKLFSVSLSIPLS